MSSTDTASIKTHNTDTEKTDQEHRLSDAIEKLTHILRHRTSWRWRFQMGIATGIGTVIGASMLAWVVIYLLSLIVAWLDLNDIPFFQNIIEQANLDADNTHTP